MLLQVLAAPQKYMMMAKASIFGDPPPSRAMALLDDVKIKAEGRKVKGFDQEDLGFVNIAAVTIGNYYKMTQNDGLWAFDERDGRPPVCRGSPVDKVWGVALRGTIRHRGQEQLEGREPPRTVPRQRLGHDRRIRPRGRPFRPMATSAAQRPH